MKKLILLILLISVSTSAQVPLTQARVVWKGISAPNQFRVITSNAGGNYEQYNPQGPSINDTTLLPMMAEIAALAKSDPNLNAILVKYVTEIDDSNGLKVWP